MNGCCRTSAIACWQLHRLVDLGFPEFTRYVCGLNTELASAILHDYPTAAAFHGVSVKRLAALPYDGRHQVGLELARSLIDAARHSVGHHHSAPYRVQVRLRLPGSGRAAPPAA